MRTIGLLGGMSWESSARYYRLANEMVRDRLGGLHSAHCVLYSVDFAGIAAMQRAGSWDAAAASSSASRTKVRQKRLRATWLGCMGTAGGTGGGAI